jgi:hypothetical protein
MSSERNEIFKKSSNSLKISLKCHAFLRKLHIFKKESRCNCRIATMASSPMGQTESFAWRVVENDFDQRIKFYFFVSKYSDFLKTSVVA